MNNRPISQNPEEQELERKKEELSALEEKLAETELGLHSLIGDTESFLQTLNAAVVEKLLERDILRLRLANALVALNPEDPETKERAARADDDVQEIRRDQEDTFNDSYGDVSQENFKSAFQSRSSEELKDLFRKLVKMAHPDLATDPEEKERRTEFMKEVNAAYEAGDYDRLQNLFEKWQESPESVQGEGIGSELVRVIRKIAQVEKRLDEVTEEITAVKSSDDYKIFIEAKTMGFEEYISATLSVIRMEIEELDSGITDTATTITDLLDRHA